MRRENVPDVRPVAYVHHIPFIHQPVQTHPVITMYTCGPRRSIIHRAIYTASEQNTSGIKWTWTTKEVITANRCGVEVMQTLQCPVHRYGTVQRSTPSVRSHFVSGPCYTSHQHHPFLLRRSFPLECHSRPPHVLGFNN